MWCTMKNILIVGAGIAGSVLAREFAEAGNIVTVLEKNSTVGGNCSDSYVGDGVYLHEYGPHIFHTSNERVWKYINRFATMEHYEHKVKSLTDRGWAPWPINYRTIELCYGETIDVSFSMWKNDIEKARSTHNTDTFEDKAVAEVGFPLYDMMIREYTRKQWNRDPKLVPSEVFGRIRVVRSFDDHFFGDTHVCLPKNGYTNLVNNILDHENISVYCGSMFSLKDAEESSAYAIFSSSRPDELCLYSAGKLEYLTTIFQRNDSSYVDRPTPIVNDANEYVGTGIIRSTDYGKMFHSTYSGPIIDEISGKGKGNALYPVRTKENTDLLQKYNRVLSSEYGIISIGRLGTYKYTNMDEAILLSLEMSDRFLGR